MSRIGEQQCEQLDNDIDEGDARPVNVNVNGRAAAFLFVVMLLAFVIESQLTQYVQSNLNFRQPYLLFYIAHSTMIIVFPIHLLYLHVTTPYSAQAYLRGLSTAVKEHLNVGSASAISAVDAFPTVRLLVLVSWCTVGITVPGLLWFAAITLASVTDVTAIWNSNAFWAYVISTKLNHSAWEFRRLATVVIASVGVLIVVYGGSEAPSSPDEVQSLQGDSTNNKPTAPLLGNALTLFASVGYGFYQVAYNSHAVPPSERMSDSSEWRRLSLSSSGADEALMLPTAPDLGALKHGDGVSPPFGLYANLLTSGMGVMTLLFLWIPIPILDHFSIEAFALPSNLATYCAIGGIALTAVLFYMTFMILLGVWGPIVTSVGNLLTIVLVLISDTIFGSAADTMNFWSLLGSAMIVCAFAVLTYDTLRR